MHRIAIQRRWADLDQLNHVNNVRYVEWAKEGLLRAQRDGVLPSGSLWPSGMTIQYRHPAHFNPEPAWVETEVNGRIIDQQIVEEGAAGRIVFATVQTQLDEPARQFSEPITTPQHADIAVRSLDASPNGQIDYPRMVELFQEGRIQYLTTAAATAGQTPNGVVIARFEMRLGSPVRWRPEPYQIHTWVKRIGNSSIDFDSQLRDGQQVLAEATATLVAIDPHKQTSRALTDTEREALRKLMQSTG